jgi:hypothetical protein
MLPNETPITPLQDSAPEQALPQQPAAPTQLQSSSGAALLESQSTIQVPSSLNTTPRVIEVGSPDAQATSTVVGTTTASNGLLAVIFVLAIAVILLLAKLSRPKEPKTLSAANDNEPVSSDVVSEKHASVAPARRKKQTRRQRRNKSGTKAKSA